MTMKRRVEPEILDALSPDDPRAIYSRRDLRRINVLMRQAGIIARLLRKYTDTPPRMLVDLGAGDGTFTYSLARRLAPYWKNVDVVVLDRQPSVGAHTEAGFRRLGWNLTVAKGDIFDFLEKDMKPGAAVTANLFLHHFEDAALSRLLSGAASAEIFVACEPHRSRFALGMSRLLGGIGCNYVTRHDARVSVRAGFRGKELSALWPGAEKWNLQEGLGIPFTQYFAAKHL